MCADKVMHGNKEPAILHGVHADPNEMHNEYIHAKSIFHSED